MSAGDHEDFGPDDLGSNGPPDPLDRLWLHPSELGRRASAGGGSAPANPGSALWLTALGAGMLGAVATLAVLALLGLLGAPDRPSRPVAGATDDRALAQLAANASGSSVVEVRVQRGDDTWNTVSAVGIGQGALLTSASALQDATSVTVSRSDGRHRVARVVGTDPLTDLGLLDVGEALADPATTENRVRVGDSVVALAASGEGQPWVSTGVVSGMDSMEMVGLIPVPGLIETDVNVVPRAAGGALVDANGHVVGVLVGTQNGRANALPIDRARGIADDIRRTGRAQHAYMGMTVRDANGVQVVAVDADSPAAKAGVRPGMVVRKIDGRPIGAAATLYSEISRHAPGDKVLLNVTGGGPTDDVEVVLASYPGASDATATTAVRTSFGG